MIKCCTNIEEDTAKTLLYGPLLILKSLHMVTSVDKAQLRTHSILPSLSSTAFLFCTEGDHVLGPHLALSQWSSGNTLTRPFVSEKSDGLEHLGQQ